MIAHRWLADSSKQRSFLDWCMMWYPEENSAISIQRALDAGMSHIECDVVYLRDWVPFVTHDNNLGRRWHPLTWVTQTCAKDLDALWLWRFDDMIRLIDKKAVLIVHLKTNRKDALLSLCDQALQYIHKGWSFDHFIISVDERNFINIVHGIDVRLLVAYCCWHLIPNDVVFLQERSVYSINVYYKAILLFPRYYTHLIQWAKSRCIPFIAWTVNNPQKQLVLKQLWVQGLFVDYI